MAILGSMAISGIIVLIGLFFAIVFSLIGAFIGNIILFDSIALAIIAASLTYSYLHIHPAFALIITIAIGLGSFKALLQLQSSKYGFWIIGGLLSVFWGFVFGFTAYAFSSDMIWFYVVFALGMAFMMKLHLKARGRSI